MLSKSTYLPKIKIILILIMILFSIGFVIGVNLWTLPSSNNAESFVIRYVTVILGISVLLHAWIFYKLQKISQ